VSIKSVYKQNIPEGLAVEELGTMHKSLGNMADCAKNWD